MYAEYRPFRIGRWYDRRVSEYDKPISDNITNHEIATEMGEGLENLYSVIKGQDANIKFVFLTGVSFVTTGLRVGHLHST